MRTLSPLCEEQTIDRRHPKPSRHRAERECHRGRLEMRLRHLAVTVVTPMAHNRLHPAMRTSRLTPPTGRPGLTDLQLRLEPCRQSHAGLFCNPVSTLLKSCVDSLVVTRHHKKGGDGTSDRDA